MKIMSVGIDLAKNVFAVHGIDEHGKAVLVRPSVRREQLLELAPAEPTHSNASINSLSFTRAIIVRLFCGLTPC